MNSSQVIELEKIDKAKLDWAQGKDVEKGSGYTAKCNTCGYQYNGHTVTGNLPRGCCGKYAGGEIFVDRAGYGEESCGGCDQKYFLATVISAPDTGKPDNFDEIVRMSRMDYGVQSSHSNTVIFIKFTF